MCSYDLLNKSHNAKYKLYTIKILLSLQNLRKIEIVDKATMAFDLIMFVSSKLIRNY
jgi:hypothetical protein